VCKNNTFHIAEMERVHFLDFGLLLKEPSQFWKVNEDDQNLVWQTVIWLCYEEMERCVSGQLQIMTDNLERYLSEDEAASFKAYI
jgi:hypothetical protein